MISILMPLYNGIEFLNDSISSVIKQSYKKWELLIGINGATQEEIDKIIQIVQDFDCEKIKISLCPNKSKTKALNILADQAIYDYICLLDVDDYWFPEKLNKQLPFMKKYDVVGSDAAYFGNILGTPRLFLGELSKPMFSLQNPIINSSAMIKKQDAWWDPSWEGLDDYRLWVHLLNNNKNFYNVSEILVNHRIHGASYFNNKNEAKRQQLKQEMPQLYDNMINELYDILDKSNWKL